MINYTYLNILATEIKRLGSNSISQTSRIILILSTLIDISDPSYLNGPLFLKFSNKIGSISFQLKNNKKLQKEMINCPHSYTAFCHRSINSRIKMLSCSRIIEGNQKRYFNEKFKTPFCDLAKKLIPFFYIEVFVLLFVRRNALFHCF